MEGNGVTLGRGKIMRAKLATNSVRRKQVDSKTGCIRGTYPIRMEGQLVDEDKLNQAAEGHSRSQRNDGYCADIVEKVGN